MLICMLSYSTIAMGQCAGGVAVADFNGDGVNDLAYSQTACTGSSTSEILLPAWDGQGSFGAAQTQYQSSYSIYQPYAVRTTTETRPIVVLPEDLGPHNNPSTNPPEALILLSNVSHGFFPGCGVTGVAEGIRICAPSETANSPVTFSIGGAGPTAMRTAAVWVDGKKVDEQLAHSFSNYSFLDASLPIAVGNHSITVFGTGWMALCKELLPHDCVYRIMQRAHVGGCARVQSGDRGNSELTCAGAGDGHDHRDTGAYGAVGGWREDVYRDEQQGAEYFDQPARGITPLHSDCRKYRGRSGRLW